MGEVDEAVAAGGAVFQSESLLASGGDAFGNDVGAHRFVDGAAEIGGLGHDERVLGGEIAREHLDQFVLHLADGTEAVRLPHDEQAAGELVERAAAGLSATPGRSSSAAKLTGGVKQLGELFGIELVDSVTRLCAMNLLLHGIGGESEEDLPVVTKDALAGLNEPAQLTAVAACAPEYVVSG